MTWGICAIELSRLLTAYHRRFDGVRRPRRGAIVRDTGDVLFNFRVAGVALDGDQVMLHRAEMDDFWALPGGRVRPTETSEQALVREMQEELDVTVRVERLLWIVENFFEYDSQRYQELGLYFLMAFPEDSGLYEKRDVYEGREEGLKLFFQWYPLDTLDQIRILPSFLSTGLRSIPDAPTHIVHADAE